MFYQFMQLETFVRFVLSFFFELGWHDITNELKFPSATITWMCAGSELIITHNRSQFMGDHITFSRNWNRTKQAKIRGHQEAQFLH